MRLVTTVFVFTVIEPPITAMKSLEFDFHKPRPPRLKNSEIIPHFFSGQYLETNSANEVYHK